MFATYLGRELGKRKKQTAIIAIGLALAVALVMVVSAISAGVRDAQAQALEAVYGVGTDITVTQAAAAPTDGAASGPQFQFGADDGTTDSGSGSRSVSGSRLTVDRGSGTLDASAVDTAAGVDGVAEAAGALTLRNIGFSGELPTFTQGDGSTAPDGGFQAGQGGFQAGGGADGQGGSSFSVDQMSVTGVDVTKTDIGPLTALTITDGRSLAADDAGQNVAVIDADYATTQSKAVGDTITIGDADVTVVGIAQSTSTSGSAADAIIPLDTAQTLADLDGEVSTIYVKAADAGSIDAVAAALTAALPDATVNTQADLASTVSGSLATVGSLITNLGTWLSVIVLAAAFVLAILLTISGVARRTREFGTLKAIGWRNGRIVGQVAGESLVTGLIGIVAGAIVGVAAILIINAISPQISVGGGGAQRLAQSGAQSGGGSGAGFGGFGGQGGFADFAGQASSVTLHADITVAVILIAAGLALLGAVLAGVFGGWRAAALRPAAALRTVE